MSIDKVDLNEHFKGGSVGINSLSFAFADSVERIVNRRHWRELSLQEKGKCKVFLSSEDPRGWCIDPDIPAQNPPLGTIKTDNGPLNYSFETKKLGDLEWFRFHGYDEIRKQGFMISGHIVDGDLLVCHSECEGLGGAWKAFLKNKNSYSCKNIYAAFSLPKILNTFTSARGWSAVEELPDHLQYMKGKKIFRYSE